VTRFSKELRQQIVRDFAQRNGGIFDAAAFLGEVNQVGESHSAHAWFEWDDTRAARNHRLDQARDFAQGLRVRFEVKTMDRGSVKVVSTTVPLVLSPVRNRNAGGGYHLTDPNDPAHLAELSRQAAQQLRWFAERFQAAIEFAGADKSALGAMILTFDAASSASLPEAAE